MPLVEEATTDEFVADVLVMGNWETRIIIIQVRCLFSKSDREVNGIHVNADVWVVKELALAPKYEATDKCRI